MAWTDTSYKHTVRTTTTTTTRARTLKASLCLRTPLVLLQRSAMSMAERGVATSARRRRERQLRSFLRHEELTVKMALARALHHSAQRVEDPRERRWRARRTTRHGDRRVLPWGRGQPAWLSREGTWCRYSGIPWRSLLLALQGCRRSMFLCRRWWTSLWPCLLASTCLFPSRSSKCPRFRVHPASRVQLFAHRSWRNSSVDVPVPSVPPGARAWPTFVRRRLAAGGACSQGLSLDGSRGGWWGPTTSRETPPPEITASPGRYVNTGQG